MASDHSPSVHPDGSESDGSSTPLRRAISGKLLFVFILGDVLGAGIYALVGEIAGEVGGAIWLPMLLALLMALLTAASYAELVTKYPRAGGAAVFAQRAFGRPIVSFLVGFSMLAAGVTSAGGLALAFSGDYLAVFLDVPAVPAAVVFLLLVGLLNARGITESLRANLGMTVIEVSGLVVIIALAGLVLSRGDGAPSRVLEFTDDTTPTLAVLGAALLAFYSFVGFETSANIAEEVEDVRRVYPRALLGAVTTAGAVYVLVGLAVSTVVPADTLAQSTGPLLEVVDAADAGIPPWVFSLVALMARDGLLPVALAKVLPGRKTPWAAIVATTAVAMVLCTTGSVAALAETVVLLLLFVFISTNIAVLVLRRDRSDTDHFRTPTALPVLALITCAVLLTQQSAATWLRAGLLLAVGIALYYVGRVVSNKTATEPRSITR
jgi:amino acid transporter